MGRLDFGGAIQIQILEVSISGSPSAVHQITYLIEKLSGEEVIMTDAFPDGILYEVLLEDIARLNKKLREYAEKHSH